MGMSPTARTLAECKRRGWIAQVVEQTIPRTFIKRDLFGIIDVIAVTPATTLIGGLCCVYKRPYDAMSGTWKCVECGTVNDTVPGQTIGIQATSSTNHSARVSKARQEPRLAVWLGAGNAFEVWSWAKRGAKGKRKVWTLREEQIVSGMGQS
jgi:hypothetical protein